MIEINKKQLCESCFCEANGDPCPNCGFSAAEYSADPLVLPMGTKLNDKIVIGRVMGRGGFGVTYLGYDLRMGKIIAIKEYYPNGIAYRAPGGTEITINDPKSEETFEKGAEKFYAEAEMVAQFNGNPNIVSVYDYFRENNTIYLVMEFLQGITLKNYIKKHGRLSDGQALFVMEKIAAALSITHSAGVLHRDISPDNIMICLDGKIKLIDFGAARQIMEESSSNLTVVMKHGYTPMEQYTKKGKQGAWTDIYSLGASVYYALTGVIIDDPYSRMDNDSELDENKHSINNDLWNILKKCTTINSSDRYGSAIDLRKALKSVSAPIKAESIILADDDLKEKTEEVSESTEAPKTEENDFPATVAASEENEDIIEIFESESVSPENKDADRSETEAPKSGTDGTKEKTKNKKTLIIGAAAAVILIVAVGIFAVIGNHGNDAITVDNPKVTATSEENAADVPTVQNTTAKPTEAAVVEAESIPDSPLYYYGFENTDGLTAVTRVADLGSLTGSAYGIGATDHPILIAEGQGAVGNALYLDGNYGVDIEMCEISDDSYSISFWYNADRVETCTPILQMGRNIGMSSADATVTWINVTKSNWGAGGADILPVVWNRNSSIGTEVSEDGVWTWGGAMDDEEHGKCEWCLLTIVVDGNRYVADDGMERIGTKYYLNGELKYEANSENMSDHGISPEIFAGGGVEVHIGINYWDPVYKGFIDELYIFDEALTDGQVKTLFEMGNPPASPVAPERQDTEREAAEPTPLETAPVDSSAIDVLGTPDRVLDFWSDTTDGYELADGATLKFKLNNYSDGVNKWDNFVVAFSNTAVTTDKPASADNYAGYAEYVVLRADAFGWGDASYAADFEHSWGEDWAGWLSLMADAEVEFTVTRNGGEVTVDYTFTGVDGTVMTETAAAASTMTADSPVYVHLAGEGAYIELLSVK